MVKESARRGTTHRHKPSSRTIEWGAQEIGCRSFVHRRNCASLVIRARQADEVGGPLWQRLMRTNHEFVEWRGHRSSWKAVESSRP